MKLPSLHLNRKTTVALTTIAVVGLLFAYYFLVHTRVQENRLKKQAFNQLFTLSTGFKENLESHKRAISKLLEGSSALIFETYLSFPESLYEKEIQRIDSLWRVYQNNPNTKNQNTYFDSYYSIDDLKIEKQTLSKMQDTIPKSAAFQLVNIEVDEMLLDELDQGKNVDVSVEISGDSILFHSKINNHSQNDPLAFSLTFYTNLKEFIDHTFNHRIFDDFVLISEKEIKYQSLDYKFETIDYDTLRKLNREINYLNNIVKNFNDKGSTGNVVTDENLVGKAVSSTNFYDINISDTDYKLFLNQFKADGKFWVLCGFIDASQFNQQKRAVEPTFLLIIFTALLFILLASQLIKLFVSSQVEQFFIHNIIFSVISFTVGSSIIVISLLSGVSYWVEDRYVKDRELVTLNNDINDAFTNELNETLNYLKLADQSQSDSGWVYSKDKIPRDSFEFGKAPLSNFDVTYDNAFWINNAGTEIFQVYDSIKPLTFLNVSSRDYFRKLREGRAYIHVNPSNQSKIKFYFQPVTSWVTSNKIVVASIHSKGAELPDKGPTIPKVAAMAIKFRSLQNCVLPVGYGFAMIDESGKVMFHDDNRLSQSENFLDECSEIDEMRSSINSRTISINSINYHNKKYRIYLRPVENMPLYLITYHDREFFRLPGVLTFYYTILFSLIGLLAVGFWVVFLFIFNYKGSKLKYKKLILNWAFPNNKKSKWYWKATFVNLLATLIISIWELAFGDKLTHSFLIVFVACNFIFPINYFLLKKCPGLKNENLSLGQIYRLVFKGHVTVVFLIILLVFNFLLIIRSYPEFWNLVFYQLALLTLFLFPFYLYKSVTLSGIYEKFKNINISHSYTSFTVSWIVLVSIIPSIFYFDIVKHNERNVWRMFNDSQITRRLYERKLEREIAGKGKVDRGVYLVYSKDKFIQQKTSFGWDQQAGFTNTLFYHLRLPVVDLSELSKSYVSNIKLGQRDWHMKVNEHSLDNTLNINYSHLNDHDSLLVRMPQNLSNCISTPVMNTRSKGMMTFLKKFINTLLIIVMVGLIYTMLFYLLRKIFGFKFLLSNSLLSSSKESIGKMVLSQEDLFIIGLPSPDFDRLKTGIEGLEREPDASGNQDSDDQTHSAPIKIKAQCIDLQRHDNLKIDDIDLVDKDVIIIDHFEYDCDELSKLHNNLIIIEKLKLMGKQLVIFSSISPRQVESIYKHPGDQPTITADDLSTHYLFDEHLWPKLMSSFKVLHYHLQPYEVKQDYSTRSNDSELKKQLGDLIKKELSASSYFENVEYLIHQKYLRVLEEYKQPDKKKQISQGQIETIKEEMILFIQDIAQTYYFSLWKTCYKNQRFLLYDLAYDGIANFKDGGTVLFLLKKGLLKFDNGIEIMNKSFRHFVIDAIGEEDALMMRKEMEQKGTWSSTKIVLIIIAISLLIFIFMVNKGSISQVSAIVTGAVALIGALLRLFSFGSGSSIASGE